MSCPVVGANASSSKGVASSSSANELFHTFRETLPNCAMPLQSLNACREKVIGGERSSCVKEASCYLGCSSKREQVRRTIFSKCLASSFADTTCRTPKQCYEFCAGGESEDICLGRLRAFVACAESKN